MESVIACCRENSFIYPVLDGCTDNTEKVIDEVIAEHPQIPIRKVFTPDVHELRTINAGLKAADQRQKGCNIILQDDVIIEDPELEDLVFKIYNHFGYSNVGYLSFRNVANVYLKDEGEIVERFRKKVPVIAERDIVESAYGVGGTPIPLPPRHFLEGMIAVGSPQCMSCEVVNRIGLMDEGLAPTAYSCHDMSLRCLQAGKRNFVFGLKFRSDIEWGGTHTNTDQNNPYVLGMRKNPFYLHSKYKDFIRSFRKTKRYRELKLVKPFTIPEIPISSEENERAIKEFYIRRNKEVGFKLHFISKYIKLPLKKILVYMGLY
jgi:glycosyltransferase involved in cell wall biosynthesis